MSVRFPDPRDDVRIGRTAPQKGTYFFHSGCVSAVEQAYCREHVVEERVEIWECNDGTSGYRQYLRFEALVLLADFKSLGSTNGARLGLRIERLEPDDGAGMIGPASGVADGDRAGDVDGLRNGRGSDSTKDRDDGCDSQNTIPAPRLM